MAWFLSATEMKSMFGSLGDGNKNNDVLDENCFGEFPVLSDIQIKSVLTIEYHRVIGDHHAQSEK